MADLCSTSQHSALLFSVRKTFSLPLGFPPVGHWRRMCTREGLVIGLFHLLQLDALFCCTVGNVFAANGPSMKCRRTNYFGQIYQRAAWVCIVTRFSQKQDNWGLRALWKKKKLIKTYFMHLQDMHFRTIAPFKIQSAPKIAKTLAYLTDSNLNKTTVMLKKNIYIYPKQRISALPRLCPIIIHYIPNGRQASRSFSLPV